jgi:NAD(P)H-hydrate epimerase
VVDCLLGTGATGAPHGPVSEAVGLIANAAVKGAKVIACDVPTGVDASTGEVLGAAVTADLTVTFHCPKPGLWIGPGKELSGTVEVLDIGIPGDDGPWQVGLIEDSACAGLPERGPEGDKFAAGAVIVAGGSPGLTGAPILAGLGAARGGAGYVTVALPASLLQASDSIPEIMGLALAEADENHCAEGVAELVERAGRAGAVVLGPGLGRSESGAAFARGVAEAVQCPLVVDADAIHAFAEAQELLAARRAPTVVTPHSGEMASLLGRQRSTVEAGRLDSVRTASAMTGSVVVFKGDDTLVADPGGDVAVSRGGAPALATAGSGDVLGGLIGALLARGVEPLQAAAAAVRLHCEAGRIAGQQGSEGVLAGDIASALPHARAALTVGSGGR